MDRSGPAQQDFSLGPGGPLHKNHWAGRANLFVGPARLDLFMLFPAFYQILYLS
jgi:hypothetical protein